MQNEVVSKYVVKFIFEKLFFIGKIFFQFVKKITFPLHKTFKNRERSKITSRISRGGIEKFNRERSKSRISSIANIEVYLYVMTEIGWLSQIMMFSEKFEAFG